MHQSPVWPVLHHCISLHPSSSPAVHVYGYVMLPIALCRCIRHVRHSYLCGRGRERDHGCMCAPQEIVFGDAHELVGKCDEIVVDQFEWDQTSVRRTPHRCIMCCISHACAAPLLQPPSCVVLHCITIAHMMYRQDRPSQRHRVVAGLQHRQAEGPSVCVCAACSMYTSYRPSCIIRV